MLNVKKEPVTNPRSPSAFSQGAEDGALRDLSAAPVLLVKRPPFKLHSNTNTHTHTVKLNLCICCLHGRQRVLVISQNAKGVCEKSTALSADQSEAGTGLRLEEVRQQ